MVDQAEIRKRREVGRLPVRGPGGDEGDRARGDGRDEELVVEARRSVRGVGVDGRVGGPGGFGG